MFASHLRASSAPHAPGRARAQSIAFAAALLLLSTVLLHLFATGQSMGTRLAIVPAYHTATASARVTALPTRPRPLSPHGHRDGPPSLTRPRVAIALDGPADMALPPPPPAAPSWTVLATVWAGITACPVALALLLLHARRRRDWHALLRPSDLMAMASVYAAPADSNRDPRSRDRDRDRNRDRPRGRSRKARKAPDSDSAPDSDAEPHTSVLMQEVLQYLDVKDGGQYLDCTFGAGGYTRRILAAAPACHVTALDQDPSVRPFVDAMSQDFPGRFQFEETNFMDAVTAVGGRRYDGVVLDLGVSSMQLDQGERGFSIRNDGLLNMRMDMGVHGGPTAADFVNSAPEEEIADVIWKYGEERASRRIARAIVQSRAQAPFTTTRQLADVVRGVVPMRSKGRRKGGAFVDPATKTFQAIRIHVNRELEALEHFLSQAQHLLTPGGRLVVVSFHSLEDRIVKEFFVAHSPRPQAVCKYRPTPILRTPDQYLQVLTRKVVTATEAELAANARSRSAKLRAAEMVPVEPGDS